jgi:ankyrin repeat protein
MKRRPKESVRRVVLTVSGNRFAGAPPFLFSARVAVFALCMFSGCTENPQNQLLSAVDRQDVKGVARLLDATPQLDVNYRTPRMGQSALVSAASMGSEEIVRLLLRHGADPNITTESNQTPLLLAAHYGHVGIAKLLIASGADVNLSESRYGHTALVSAAQQGHSEIVALLLDADADTLKRTSDGQTALQLASQYNRQSVVRTFQAYEQAKATNMSAESVSAEPPK